MGLQFRKSKTQKRWIILSFRENAKRSFQSTILALNFTLCKLEISIWDEKATFAPSQKKANWARSNTKLGDGNQVLIRELR